MMTHRLPVIRPGALPLQRWSLSWVVSALIVSMATGAGAAPAPPSAPIRVMVNGLSLQFPVPPQNRSGTLLVPIRAIAEALGFSVEFESMSKNIHLKRPGTLISLAPGSTAARVNGQLKTLAAPPLVVDGSTLVPVRLLSENLGAAVIWDAEAQSVQIVTKPQADYLHLTGRLRVHDADSPSASISYVIDTYIESQNMMSALLGFVFVAGQSLVSFVPRDGVWVPQLSLPAAGLDGSVQRELPLTDIPNIDADDYMRRVEGLFAEVYPQLEITDIGIDTIQGIDTIVQSVTVPSSISRQLMDNLLGQMGGTERVAILNLSVTEISAKLWVDSARKMPIRLEAAFGLNAAAAAGRNSRKSLAVQADFMVIPANVGSTASESPMVPDRKD